MSYAPPFESFVKRLCALPWLWVGAACVHLFGSADVNAQSFPSQYANALQRAQYAVFTGDVNGDSCPDVLAKAKVAIILIDYEVPIPIRLRPASPTFVLLSNSGCSYTLTSDPPASIVQSNVWVPATHDLVFGDVLGTGSAAMLMRARNSGYPSFLIVTSPSSGMPDLLQQLTVADLGIEVAGTASSVSLRDVNQDGRADLVLTTSGTLAAALLAGADGRFSKPQGSDAVLMAWRVFCAALDAGDLTSAMAQISSASQEVYLEGLVGVGNEITALSASWSDIRAVDVRADYAVFSLVSNYGAQRRIHIIVLVKKGDRWVIEQF